MLWPIPQTGKMPASELIHYFSNHPAAFGFQVSLSPDNGIVSPANKRTNKSHSDFQTGIGAAVHELKTQSSIFIIPNLLWLILYRVLMVE